MLCSAMERSSAIIGWLRLLIRIELSPKVSGRVRDAVIGITAGLKTSDYSYLLGRLLLLPCAARGSVRRRGNTRASSCSPGKSHIRLGGRLSPRRTIPVAIRLRRSRSPRPRPALRPNRVDRSSFRSFIGISFAVVAVGLAGFLVTLTSRPAPAPKTAAAALPALEAAPPPLTAAASNPPEQAIGPEERLARLEPPPIQIGVPQEDNLEIVPPPDSSPLVELQPSPREATPPMVLAPLPPSRPLELAPPVNPPTSYDHRPRSTTSQRIPCICRAACVSKPIRV